jgi:glycosyltransferase involved in cell wall biosynthesis
VGKPCKVLLLIEDKPVPADTRVWTEAATLRDQGFEVSVISPKGFPRYRESYVCLEGIHIYRYSLPSTAGKSTAYLLEYSIAMLMTFLLSLKVWVCHGFDVIHASNPPDTFFLLGLFYRLLGKKFVFDLNDLSPEMFQVKFKGRMKVLHKLLLVLEWCSFRTAHVVITTNLSQKQVTIQRGRCSPDKVVVVRNGPNLQRLRHVPPEPELKGNHRYLLAYVGAMEVQDGIEYALHALHDLVHKRRHRDVLLVLMGDGGHAPALQSLAHDLQLDDFVYFTGWVTADEIVRYLSVADVGISPDPQNGFNEHCTMVKTMEYMAMGLPVVAFDLAETHFSAQDAALYAIPNRVDDFADKIEALLANEAMRLRLGAQGRKRIEEALNWEHDKKNLLLAYNMLFPKHFPQAAAEHLQETNPVIFSN